jgi:hypothetical protein
MFIRLILFLILLSVPGFAGDGIFLRIGNPTKVGQETRDLIKTHPLVDAVFLTYHWSQVEPEQGVFDFSLLHDDMEEFCNAGKPVIVSINLYSAKREMTPAWIYDRPDVVTISWSKKGNTFRVPKVWEPGFTHEYLKPLISALRDVVNGDPCVESVKISYGHIGNLFANPDGKGSKEFLNHGWTWKLWRQYVKRTNTIYQNRISDTPLLAITPGRLLSISKQDFYTEEAAKILDIITDAGINFIHFNVSPELEGRKGMQIVYDAVVPVAHKPIQYGFGDDQPLWVFPHRRNNPPTLNHDDDYLQASIDRFFGEGLNPSIYYIQDNLMRATHPDGEDFIQSTFDILNNVRNQLKGNH